MFLDKRMNSSKYPINGMKCWEIVCLGGLFLFLGSNDGLRNQWRKGWSCLYEYGVGTFPSFGGVADAA